MATPAELPDPTDPVSIVHRAIWTAMTGFPAWAGVVKEGNRVRFDAGQQFPPKLGVGTWMAGDAPLVSLMQGRFNFVPSVNSLAVGMTISYPLVIVGKDLNALPFNVVRWQSFRALCAAGDTLGLPKLLRGWNISDGGDDPLNGRPEWTRGVSRWLSICSINTELAISKSDVAAGRVPTV